MKHRHHSQPTSYLFGCLLCISGLLSSTGCGGRSKLGTWRASTAAGDAGRTDDATHLAAESRDTLDAGSDFETDKRDTAVDDKGLRLLAGGLGGSGNQDGTGPLARFHFPVWVASDSAGNLFVTDRYNQTLRKVVVATGAVTTLAGSPEDPGKTDGMGSTARFSSPHGVASDHAGNLFVADFGNHTIRKVVVATGIVTTLAGAPGEAGSTDGMGTDARFCNPNGLAMDGQGNLFVTDQCYKTIRKIVVSTGAVMTLAGSVDHPGSADGIGPTAGFFSPEGVASDGIGNLFVADGNCTIRKIVIATGEVTTYAGSADNPGKKKMA
jgi:streptogramin lyase